MNSTKKDGIPPKADKSKAKNGKPRTTGNEAGVKLVNKNRENQGPRSTDRKASKNKKFDRHSRTGKSETTKSQTNKLGDEADAQVEGEADAKAEEEAEEEESEEKPQLKSADDYFNELAAQESLNKTKKQATPTKELSDAEIVVKETEILVAPSAGKKIKQKAKKEKNILEVDLKIVSSAEKPAREFNNTKRETRKPIKGGKKTVGKKESKPQNKLTEQNFPSL